MPIYQWCCNKCGSTTEILRSFSEYENPPIPEEIAKMEDSACNHVWERRIGGKQSIVRGASWGGSKGNW